MRIWVLTALAVLLVPAGAAAERVEFLFVGEVRSVNGPSSPELPTDVLSALGVEPGALVKGLFAFESETRAMSSGPGTSLYVGAIRSVEISIGDYDVRTSGERFQSSIALATGGFGGDSYDASAAVVDSPDVFGDPVLFELSCHGDLFESPELREIPPSLDGTSVATGSIAPILFTAFGPQIGIQFDVTWLARVLDPVAPVRREPIFGVVVGSRGLLFQVESNGCTTLDDFVVELSESLPLQVSLVRTRPDTCRGVRRVVYLHFPFDELGLEAGDPFLISNPFAVVTVPGTTSGEPKVHVTPR